MTATRPLLLLAVLLLISAGVPLVVAAQEATPTAVQLLEWGVAPRATPALPAADSAAHARTAGAEQARIPMRRFVEARRIEDAVAAPMQVRDRRGVPLMIAGAALFVAGAVIDGDAGTIVMVTGAAIGAYGLYLYF